MSGGRRVGKPGVRTAGWVVGILALGAGEAPLPAPNTPERRADAPVAPPRPSVAIPPLPDDPEPRAVAPRPTETLGTPLVPGEVIQPIDLPGTCPAPRSTAVCMVRHAN